MSKVPRVLEGIMAVEIADLLEEIKDSLAPNDFKDTFLVDLSVAHVGLQFEMPSQIRINTLTVMPTPATMSLKINSTADKVIEIALGETITITKHEIKRFYVSNEADAGNARIHIFGRIGG